MRNLHLARTLFFLGVFTANTGCAEQPPETAPDAQPVTVVPQEVEILSVQVSKLERNQFADQTSARQQEEQPKSDQELIEGTWQVEPGESTVEACIQHLTRRGSKTVK